MHSLLESLGFGRKEVEVYLTILQNGKISATDIALKTGINRTTVYSVARELIKKGVIREDLGKKTRSFMALPPSELSALTEKEERRLDDRKRMIHNAIVQLEPLTKGLAFAAPKITFIEEENLERFLHKRNEEWANSIMDADGTWWGFQDHTFAEYYGKWIDWSWAQPFQRDMHLKLLTNESAVEKEFRKKKYERRLMKFWKHKQAFTGTLWVMGTYLVLIETAVKPRYLVEIHDAILANNMRSIFSVLWDSN